MTISEYAQKFIGRPYVWAGDGSGKCGGGFDCSGLVLECLQALGILPQKDLTAQGIHDALVKLGWTCPRTISDKADSVIFFGRDKKHITHVAVSLGDGLMIESGGGGSKCVTPEKSTGMVRVRPVSSRKDMVAVLGM